MVAIDSMVIVETDSYPLDGPLLWYLGRLAETEGLPVTAAAAGHEITGHPLLVGHGTASRLAGTAAEADLPVVFFSPYLDEPDVAGALHRLRAPGLVVGSVSDHHWDREAAARLTPVEVLQLPAADHLLELPGDPLGSLAVLTRVLERCHALLRRLTRNT